MIDILIHITTTKDTVGVCLDIIVSPKQNTLSVQPVHQNQPHEELDTGCAFGFPEGLENRRILKILKNHPVISARGVDLIALNEGPSVS